MLWLSCAALHRWNQRAGQGRLTLCEAGAWVPPGERQQYDLAGSSVAMGGVLWLHGRSAEGGGHSLMLLPDVFEHPDGRRWTSIWFHQGRVSRTRAAPPAA